MFRIAVLVLVATSLVTGAERSGDRSSPLATMVGAERSFAKRSVDANTRDAFVAYFGPDAVLMRPGPVNAQKWFADHPKWGLEGLLTWDPSWAFVSAAGDVGISTGPWQFRTERALTAKPVAHGFFVTVWVANDAEWKVKFDHGVGTPEPTSPIEPFDASGATAPAWPVLKADQGAARASFDRAETAFLEAFNAKGSSAYDTVLATDGRVYRPDHFPAVGAHAAHALADAAPTPGLKFVAAESGIARSVDLAWVYGTLEPSTKPATEMVPGTYLHVWRRGADAEWRLALDVVDPPTKKTE